MATDVASLLVRIGGEAAGYMAMLGKARTSTSSTFAAMAGMARGLSGEFASSLGIKMPESLQRMTKGLEMASLGMSQLGGKMSLTANLSKLSAGPVLMLVEAVGRLAVMAGTAIKPWADAQMQWGSTVDKAATSHQAFVDQMMESEDAYLEATALYDRMRTKLGLLGAEWEVSGKRTEENAARLGRLTDRLTDHIHAMKGVSSPVEIFTQRMLTLGRALEEQKGRLADGTRSVGEFIESLAEMNDVARDRDPAVALGELMEQFKLLAASGEYSAAALHASFAPRVKALEEELAKLGISLPAPFQEFAAALAGPGSGLGVLEHFIQGIRAELPDAAAIANAALKSGFEGVGASIRDARGELTELGRELEALTREVTIKVHVDSSTFDRWLAERGLQPDTGGRVP